MMKLGLISDVHGDPHALELAWAHLAALGVERVVCAGDVVGYGPLPDRAVAFLKKHEVATARGNHDRWAIERGPKGVDEFGGATPTAETLGALREMPTELVLPLAGQVAVVVHGSPRSDMEYVTRRSYPPPLLRQTLRTLNADLLVVGHTHSPMCYRCEEGLVVNPGSVVSVPVVRSSRTFAVVDLPGLTASFHDVESGRQVEVRPWGE